MCIRDRPNAHNRVWVCFFTLTANKLTVGYLFHLIAGGLNYSLLNPTVYSSVANADHLLQRPSCQQHHCAMFVAAAGNVDGVRSHFAASDAKVVQTASLRLRISR